MVLRRRSGGGASGTLPNGLELPGGGRRRRRSGTAAFVARLVRGLAGLGLSVLAGLLSPAAPAADVPSLRDEQTLALCDFRSPPERAFDELCGSGPVEVESDVPPVLQPGAGVLLDGRTRLFGPLAPLAAPLTIEALIRLDGPSPGQVHGLFEQFEYLACGCRLGIDPGNRLVFQISDPKARSMIHLAGRTPLELGRWYHVAATYDGQVMRVWLNGREDGAMPWAGGLVPGRRGMTIGYESGPNYYFVGAIAYLRLSRVARSRFPHGENPTGPPPGPAAAVTAHYPDVTAYFFPAGEPVPVTCRVRNDSDRECEFRLALELSLLGGAVTKTPPLTVGVPARQQKETVLPVTLTVRGLYQATLTVESGGAEVQRQGLPPLAIVEPLPPLTAVPAASRFGGQPTYLMPGSERVGMKWNRFWDYDTSWHKMEPERGTFVWEKTDERLRQAKAKGEEVLWCLCYTPAWASSVPDRATVLADPALKANYGDRLPGLYDSGQLAIQYPAKDLADWRRYVAAVVQRYGDRVTYWEIWNEPNCPNFLGTAAQYTDILRAAYETIKATDPGATVVGIAGCPGWLGFTEAVFKLGGIGCMDVLAVHNYTYDEPEVFGCDRKVAETRELMRRYGRVLPIWNTEVGSQVPPKVRGRPMTWEEFQANLERVLAGQPVSPWFERCEVRRRGGQAYATLSGIWPTTEDRAARYLVRQYVLELSEGVERFNLHYGATVSHGKLPLLTGVAHAMMARALATATFVRRVEAPGPSARVYLFRQAGQTVAVCWTTQPHEEVVALTAAQRLAMADLFGNPGEVRGDGQCLALSLTDSPIYLFGVPDDLKLWQPLTGKAPATVIAGEGFGVTAEVSNLQREPLAGSLTVANLPKGWRVEPAQRPVTVAAGAKTGLDFRVQTPADAPRGAITADLELTAADRTFSAALPVTVIQTLPCPAAPAAARLDGDLAEWTGAPTLLDAATQVVVGKPSPMFEKTPGTWWGPDDLSGKLWYGRAGDSLWLALEVRDDSLAPPPDLSQGYKWDCVELFLDGRPAGQLGSTQYGPGVAQLFIRPPDAAGACAVAVHRGTVSAVEAAGKRTPQGYTLEVRIPLTAASFPGFRAEPGAIFGVDVALDDADAGQERKVQLVWQGSGENYRDTSLFARLRF